MAWRKTGRSQGQGRGEDANPAPKRKKRPKGGLMITFSQCSTSSQQLTALPNDVLRGMTDERSFSASRIFRTRFT